MPHHIFQSLRYLDCLQVYQVNQLIIGGRSWLTSGVEVRSSSKMKLNLLIPLSKSTADQQPWLKQQYMLLHGASRYYCKIIIRRIFISKKFVMLCDIWQINLSLKGGLRGNIAILKFKISVFLKRLSI